MNKQSVSIGIGATITEDYLSAIKIQRLAEVPSVPERDKVDREYRKLVVLLSDALFQMQKELNDLEYKSSVPSARKASLSRMIGSAKQKKAAIQHELNVADRNAYQELSTRMLELLQNNFDEIRSASKRQTEAIMLVHAQLVELNKNFNFAFPSKVLNA